MKSLPMLEDFGGDGTTGGESEPWSPTPRPVSRAKSAGRQAQGCRQGLLVGGGLGSRKPQGLLSAAPWGRFAREHAREGPRPRLVQRAHLVAATTTCCTVSWNVVKVG